MTNNYDYAETLEGYQNTIDDLETKLAAMTERCEKAEELCRAADKYTDADGGFNLEKLTRAVYVWRASREAK